VWVVVLGIFMFFQLFPLGLSLVLDDRGRLGLGRPEREFVK